MYMYVYMLCGTYLDHAYLCLGNNGDPSYDLSLIGDLFLGSYDIWQSLVVLCVLLAIKHLWHLRKETHTHTQNSAVGWSKLE